MIAAFVLTLLTVTLIVAVASALRRHSDGQRASGLRRLIGTEP